MLERFNGRISDILATTRRRPHEDSHNTFQRDTKLYNDHLPQRVLGHRAPPQAIEAWRKDHPEIFVRRLKNQTGLDI